MGNTATTRTYAKAEFTSTTPPGNPNEDIFATEVAGEALSAQPDQVYAAGTDIVVQWTSALPVAADITALDALVAAHTGGAFASNTQQSIVEAETSDDTGDPVVRNTLTTGQLPGGDYVLAWYAEGKVDAVVAGTGVAIRFYMTKNGGSREERGSYSGDLNQYNPFSGTAVINVDAGDEYVFETEFEKLGATSNPAYIQRCRTYLKPF